MWRALIFAFGYGQWVWHGVAMPAAWLFAICMLATVMYLRWRQPILWLSILFGWGALLGLYTIQAASQAQLPESLDRQSVAVTFEVTSLPVNVQGRASFKALVKSVDSTLHSPVSIVGKTLQVSWFRPSQTVAAGQIWQSTLKLKRPRGTVNFGGFDYQAYLLSQGVFATGSVKGSPTLLGEATSVQSLRENVSAQLPQSSLQYARFFKALLVADKSQLSTEDWQVLQTTGTIHLMAISGLHIGIVGVWGFWLGALFTRIVAHLSGGSLNLAVRLIPFAGSIGFATVYAALAGFAIPTIRALLACWLVNLAVLFGRRFSLLSLFSLCFVGTLLLQPFAFLNMGFWLSFSAVGVLMLVFSCRVGRSRFGLISAQWYLLIGMLLPLVLQGASSSLVAPLANLVAVPLVSLIIVPLLFVGSVLSFVWQSLGDFIFLLADSLFGFLWRGLVLLADIPWAQQWFTEFSQPLVLVLGICASLCLLSPLALRLMPLGLLLALMLFYVPRAEHHTVKLTVLDVGQGLSVVIDTPGLDWVYDTGPKPSQRYDTGERILAPFLRRSGIEKLGLIVSHDDNDHAGGAAYIEKHFQLDQYWAGEASESATPHDRPCYAGHAWQDDAIQIEVLWPPKPETVQPLSGNRASCVVLLTVNTHEKPVRILLPGDIDAYVERRILSRLSDQVDVLVAPHHGSRSSSSSSFIEKLEPKWVIHSAGFKHHYGHPHPHVVEKYALLGAQQYVTAQQGAIQIEIDLHNTAERDVDTHESLRIKTARAEAKRLWH